ncbi:hypothetical protein ACLB2K_045967 [Fragaria x ananassa]
MSLTTEAPLKRPECDLIPTTEQPEAKRPKIGDSQLAVDTPMELQSDSDSEWEDTLEDDFDENLCYCIICRKMVAHSHTPELCPKRSRGFGMFCYICHGPCKSKTDEHKGDQVERIKSCTVCGSQARHWTQDCPFADSDDESY